ncbi:MULTISPECIES: glycoside hydrolase family 3 N-terminal domain-containing protein [Streptacidiphilus]|uniref:Glycoside hydrolase family 3 N-terminal domain-containing protein n=1 Tax=Streptacidiphilus cavernicola TaxID=3342716 RepID=A0ABV6UN89_9ACTN|nr:glycoside hydrolase family 3 N-terminal domain-containing protein [Streptacidiphilus jeojiense]
MPHSATSTRLSALAHRLRPATVRVAVRVAVRGGALTAGAALVLTGCGAGGGTDHRISADSRASGSASAAGSPSRTGSPSPSRSSAVPGASPAAPASSASGGPASCTNASRLAGWSDRRLAMLTIAVPASEDAVGSVAPEVAAGAGGVLLFGSSAPSGLGADLTALKKQVPGGIGLLVMTDEEGGAIQRMDNLVGSLPWPGWMGAHWTPDQIRQAAARVGARMAAAQVNMDLAPVADVDGSGEVPGRGNPDGLRSFSGDPAVAARDTVAFMNGLRSAGVVPVLKHFPGLGGSTVNSDFAPAHTVPWSAELNGGLTPFSTAIAAGAPAVMMSNDSVPGLTTLPAGLSATMIGTELRGRLGFHGLVLTDSLSAGAVSGAGYSMPQAAVQALRAGADMVMFDLGPTVQAQTSAIASAEVAAVADGRLPRTRLLSAATSVLSARQVDLCRG